MDYNFWDDRTHGLEINPCDGCEDYQDEKCISNGGCGSVIEEKPCEKLKEAWNMFLDNIAVEWHLNEILDWIVAKIGK